LKDKYFYHVYKLPIWVTELAVVDYSVRQSWKTPRAATQIQYFTAACQMLEGLDYVERYACFAVPQSSAQPATNLLVVRGDITDLGNAYEVIETDPRSRMFNEKEGTARSMWSLLCNA